MSFHEMPGQPMDPDGQSAGTGAARIGSRDQRQVPGQGSSGELDSYLTYAEMQELQYNIGELLHRMVDSCIAFAVRPQKSSRN